MSTTPPVVSCDDGPPPAGDLEEGGVKKALSPRVLPRCVNISLDVLAVVYMLFSIGLVAWMVVTATTNSWSDPWLPVLLLYLPMVAIAVRMGPKLDDYLAKRTPPSDGGDDYLPVATSTATH